MALNETFDAKKFWDQAMRIAISKKLSKEEAEDFASMCLERVLKYQYYLPMKWAWSLWFRGWASKDKRTISFLQPLGDSEDFSLEDLIEFPKQEVEQKENLTPTECFISLISRMKSKNLIRKIRKTFCLRNEEFKEYIDQLEPIEIEKIDL